MADARFDISIEAENVGVDATSDQLNTLVDRMTKANTVATKFDTVVAAARARLDETAVAASAAAQALQLGEMRYRELEGAASRAAKSVEKAAAAGKDTTKLQASATAAAEAARVQGEAVDALRVKSTAAAKSQQQMTATLKALEGQQAAASKATSGATAKVEAAAPATSRLATVAAVGAAAFVAFAAATVAGGLSLLKFGFNVQTNAVNMNRLAMAQQRMQLGMQRLFKGLQWDKFTRGLEDVMSLFDEGTSSANGMKKLIETIFQPLLDVGAKAAPYVKEMFKGMISGALGVAIAVLRVRNEIFKSMSPETRAAIKAVSDQILTLKNAFALGEGAATLMTVAAGALAVALIIGAIPLALIVISAQRVAAIFEWLSDTFPDFIDGLGDWVDSATTAASDMINGIIKGIKDGASAVGKAMTDLASGALKSFKTTLGIASPSKVFALQAQYTADGYVQGIEQSAPEVNSALETMVGPASAGVAPAPAAPAAAPASSSRTITIQSLTIGAGPVAAQNWEDFKRAVSEVMEGAAITIGGGEVPA